MMAGEATSGELSADGQSEGAVYGAAVRCKYDR